MSVRLSTDLESRHCSGDMYCGDPMIMPVAVSSPMASSSPSSLATPKSSTFTRSPPMASGSSTRKRFDGFRSRWMMPAWWAAARAVAACRSSRAMR